jgi:hypothetical protein
MFDYKQRPRSRGISQPEWDRILSNTATGPIPVVFGRKISRPVAIKAVDYPTTHNAPESVAATPSGDGSGRPASFSRIFEAPYAICTGRHVRGLTGPCALCDLEFPSTRYTIEFAPVAK